MDRHNFIIAIVGLAMLNGMFSPLREQFFVILVAFAPAFFIGSPLLVLYLTMLVVATVTIMLAGVPTALFERATGRATSDGTSMTIWLVGTAILSLPGLLVLLQGASR